MTITKKLMSFSLALFLALGVLVSPFFANKSKADTRTAYTGIGIIDDFLNDPRWSEGNEWTNSTTPKLAGGYGTGCYAYVADYAAYCYNARPESGDDFYDINEIRVGDVISVGNPNTWSVGHWFIVIKREGNVLTIAEGNAMDQVLMSRDFTILADENRFDGDRADRCFLTGYHFLESTSYGWKDTREGWVFYNEEETRITGWQTIDNITYYFGPDGIMKTGWVLDNGNWYYFEDSGRMHTGWIYDGAWYYLNPDNGVMVASNFVVDCGMAYYMYPSGAMATGWQYLNDKWYYFVGSGYAATGWIYDGAWYYLNPDYTMATGWVNDNGTMYFMNGSGAMETGWLFIDGYWYYFNNSGAMQTGWIYSGGCWYYLYEDGKMAADTYVDNYYVDASGAWVA